MAAANERTFSVAFDCKGNAVGKFCNEMTVRLIEPKLIDWEIASDEHGFHGGGGQVVGDLSCAVMKGRLDRKHRDVVIETLKEQAEHIHRTLNPYIVGSSHCKTV